MMLFWEDVNVQGIVYNGNGILIVEIVESSTKRGED